MGDVVKGPGFTKTCDSPKKNGERCRHQAGYGTDHLGYGRCKFHGGNSPTHKAKAAREMVQDRMVAFGTPIDVEPGEALLGEVRRSAGIVRWLEQVIAEFSQVPIETLREDARSILQTMGDQGREIGVWVKLYQDERKMLREAANLALRSNIAERQVQLAEEQGRLLAHVIQAVLGDPELGLSAQQRQASRAVAQRHLLAISS